jgi:hypothetical protein
MANSLLGRLWILTVGCAAICIVTIGLTGGGMSPSPLPIPAVTAFVMTISAALATIVFGAVAIIATVVRASTSKKRT